MPLFAPLRKYVRPCDAKANSYSYPRSTADMSNRASKSRKRSTCLSQSYHITVAARARQMPCRSRRRRTLLYLGLEWQQTSLACRAAAQVPLKLCLASYGSVKCRLGYSCGKSWSRHTHTTLSHNLSHTHTTLLHTSLSHLITHTTLWHTTLLHTTLTQMPLSHRALTHTQFQGEFQDPKIDCTI
jgi:hypothetical protein